VRAFGVGKLPMIPDRACAITISGPDIRNIGAPIAGNARFARSTAGNGLNTAILDDYQTMPCINGPACIAKLAGQRRGTARCPGGPVEA
jgi:hypothetical protein